MPRLRGKSIHVVQTACASRGRWEAEQKEGVFYMAHTCPVCRMTCHCNGDIDDICLDLEEDILACTHCPDDEDDFEEDFWEDEL